MMDSKAQLFIPSPTDMNPFCDEIEYVGIEDEAERKALIAKYKEEGAKFRTQERGWLVDLFISWLVIGFVGVVLKQRSVLCCRFVTFN